MPTEGYLLQIFSNFINCSLFSVDFRQVKEGSHWSSDHVFGSRASFDVAESVLVIERVMEADSGQYKCRIDFEKSPTKNYVVNLSVIGKFLFYSFLSWSHSSFFFVLLFFQRTPF